MNESQRLVSEHKEGLISAFEREIREIVDRQSKGLRREAATLIRTMVRLNDFKEELCGKDNRDCLALSRVIVITDDVLRHLVQKVEKDIETACDAVKDKAPQEAILVFWIGTDEPGQIHLLLAAYKPELSE